MSPSEKSALCSALAYLFGRDAMHSWPHRWWTIVSGFLAVSFFVLAQLGRFPLA